MTSEQRSKNAETGRKRFSTRRVLLVVGVLLLLAFALGYALIRNNLTPTQSEPVVSFDFDNDDPTLAEGQNLPLNQTSDGITAFFSSPSDAAEGSAFSVQRYETTFITLSQFSGKYLYDNKPSRDVLEIRFSQQLKSVSLTFATYEYQTGPTAVKLTAYLNSADTTPVGSASARGTILTGLYPQGILSFDSGNEQFNIVRIEIPSDDSSETTNFFVDNIKVS